MVVQRPSAYLDRTRQPGQADDVWWTNVTYWLTYPAAAVKIAAGDKAGAQAWKRIRAIVAAELLAASTLSPEWDPQKPTWPLPRSPKKWGAGGSFGARRPWNKDKPHTRNHAGVDLGAPAGTPVLAPEDGVVIDRNSGWETNKQGQGVKAIVLQLKSGKTILLGGIRPESGLVPNGAPVLAGQRIAEVGEYPEHGDSMVHVQLYDGHLTAAQVVARKSWKLGAPRPTGLLDPTEYLVAASQNPVIGKEVGLFADPKSDDQGALVDNDTDGGEVAEGDDSSSGDTPSSSNMGLVIVGVGVGVATVVGGVLIWRRSRSVAASSRRRMR